MFNTVEMDFDALFNEKTFQFSDFQEFTVCYCVTLPIGQRTTEAKLAGVYVRCADRRAEL